MKTLHLNLKKKWFDLIAGGKKKEEYREIKDYYCRKFGRWDWTESVYSSVKFRNGYAKNAPTMEFEIKNIRVGRGKPELGAPIDREVFIIELGERML